MKKTLIILGVIAVVIISAIMWVVGYYNNFVTAAESVDSQWAQVETAYQRRFDLVPNLVESVKGAMSQEQEVFGNIAEARTRYANAQKTGDLDDQIEATQQYESALSRLLVIMENYPQLSSVETVQDLMTQLEGTENRVSVERKKYNDQVRDYNVMIKRFPGMFFASIFGFEAKPFFEAAEGAETAPTVNLNVSS